MKDHEKVMKSRAQWRKRNQVKKMKILLTVILVFLCLSVAAGAILAWVHIRGMAAATSSGQTSVSSRPEESGEALPVYDDTLSLMLVNSSRSIPDDYSVQKEEFQGVTVDGRIIAALDKMMEDAQKAGVPLTLTGGYVDAETQDNLYHSAVQKLMEEENLSQVRAENQAQMTVGQGGYNENQTGLAVEFSAQGDDSAFEKTAQYRWLVQNSVSYGFILRFPQDKESATGMSYHPAHFRYVGSHNAVKMRELSMCLEEYVPYLAKQGGS